MKRIFVFLFILVLSLGIFSVTNIFAGKKSSNKKNQHQNFGIDIITQESDNVDLEISEQVVVLVQRENFGQQYFGMDIEQAASGMDIEVPEEQDFTEYIFNKQELVQLFIRSKGLSLEDFLKLLNLYRKKVK